MAARENAWFNADKSVNQTDSVVETNTNQLKSSGAGNFRPGSSTGNNQALRMSNDSAVAEQKGFFEDQSHGVAHHNQMDGGGDFRMVNHGNDGEGFKQDMRGLEEMFSKLNPMAPDFYSPLVANSNRAVLQESAPHFAYGNALVPTNSPIDAGGNSAKEKQVGSSHGKPKTKNYRTSWAQREHVIRRTVYVSEIDNQIAEEQLAALFTSCGQVDDCRICGDPYSVLRFGFVEFANEKGARNALSLAGTVLGSHTIKVEPSKTAIAPVNHKLLPGSEDERERCARTIYCTNIDKEVIPKDIRLFFESFCGEVIWVSLLGDRCHSTRIAFVEFAISESAIAALNCSGVILGELPIRVSPSKTPIRHGVPRSAIQ